MGIWGSKAIRKASGDDACKEEAIAASEYIQYKCNDFVDAMAKQAVVRYDEDLEKAEEKRVKGTRTLLRVTGYVLEKASYPDIRN